MRRFVIEKTPIGGLQLIQRQPIGDRRGYLQRLFCIDDLRVIIGSRTVMQINHTMTSKVGTVRGMHYQNVPYADMKLVSCLRGKVFDVAVDLRKDSPTFLKWHAKILSAQNFHTLCIPEGFAHGFQTLTPDCELIYLHTAVHTPQAEAGLNALDPLLAISWPLPITERSARDQNHAMLTSDFPGLPL